MAQLTMGACPPLLGWESARRPTCKAFNNIALQTIKSLHPDIVLLEADWLFYLAASGPSPVELTALQATVKQLQSLGVRRVVVFGNLPIWRMPQPRVSVKLWLDNHTLPERTDRYLNTASTRADRTVRDAIATTGALFVSPIDVLCDERGCLLTTDRSHWTPLAWDAAHLTEAGSTYLIAHAAAGIFGS
jgi:hypothetical protein